MTSLSTPFQGTYAQSLNAATRDFYAKPKQLYAEPTDSKAYSNLFHLCPHESVLSRVEAGWMAGRPKVTRDQN